MYTILIGAGWWWYDRTLHAFRKEVSAVCIPDTGPTVVTDMVDSVCGALLEQQRILLSAYNSGVVIVINKGSPSVWLMIPQERLKFQHSMQTRSVVLLLTEKFRVGILPALFFIYTLLLNLFSIEELFSKNAISAISLNYFSLSMSTSEITLWGRTLHKYVTIYVCLHIWRALFQYAIYTLRVDIWNPFWGIALGKEALCI